MSDKTFEEWKVSVNGSFSNEEWERFIWDAGYQASRAALLADEPDVEGLVELIGNVVFADEHCTDDLLKRETIATLLAQQARIKALEESGGLDKFDDEGICRVCGTSIESHEMAYKCDHPEGT